MFFAFSIVFFDDSLMLFLFRFSVVFLRRVVSAVVDLFLYVCSVSFLYLGLMCILAWSCAFFAHVFCFVLFFCEFHNVVFCAYFGAVFDPMVILVVTLSPLLFPTTFPMVPL